MYTCGLFGDRPGDHSRSCGTHAPGVHQCRIVVASCSRQQFGASRRPPLTREVSATGLAEATGGDPNAQNALGMAYRIEWGVVPQDYPTSVEWYRRAAEQGHAEAQFQLGAAYLFGRGVPEDPIQTHKWLNLAASRMSGERFEKIKKVRDLLADEMSVDQLNTARRLAAEWRLSTWAEVQKTR